MKKKICQAFSKHGLDITVDANKKIIQYLDAELNLRDGTYRPYLKPGDKPLYVQFMQRATIHHP